MYLCFRGINSITKGPAINICRFSSTDKSAENKKYYTKIDNFERETQLKKEIIEMKRMLDCIYTILARQVEETNSVDEEMSEVDSSNVNAFIRKISNTRY